MTRKEAIKIFNTVLFFGKCEASKEELEECLKMAIKALEQEPKLQNRYFALTQDQMCLFCPYEREHKAESKEINYEE